MAELDQDPPLPRLQQEIRPPDPPQRPGLPSLPYSAPYQTTHHHRGTPHSRSLPSFKFFSKHIFI
jgi:hypothetical protein